jgi:hypothetical protein
MIVEAWWTQIEPGVVVLDEQTGDLDRSEPRRFRGNEGRPRGGAEGVAAPEAEPVDGAGSDASVAAQPDGLVPQDAGPMPPPLQSKERPLRKYYQAFFCGDVLLEKRCCEIKNLRRYPTSGSARSSIRRSASGTGCCCSRWTFSASTTSSNRRSSS